MLLFDYGGGLLVLMGVVMGGNTRVMPVMSLGESYI